MMRRLVITTILILLVCFCYATNYYLSNSGNDANSGTSPAEAWQTIDHLNTITLHPGDSILFESGGIFRGEIDLKNSGTADSLIYFGKYGTGALPIISGATEVTGWSVYQDNIYTAPFTSMARQLFANDQLMTIARYPNYGYLFQQGATGNNGFMDSTLNQPENFWKGATLRIRTNDRAWEIRTVDSSVNGEIYLESSLAYPISSGYGYYLDNLLPLLDTVSEWYFDSLDQKLYFNAPDNADPNSLNIEASAFDDGILLESDVDFIQITNLQFENQGECGAKLLGPSKNINFIGCRFSGQNEQGILTGAELLESTIQQCIFENISGQGISGNVLRNSVIDSSLFKNIGTVAGYGVDNVNQGQAIHFESGDSVTILFNMFDSTGNSAINPNGTNILILKNIISHSLLHFNNLGSIYCFGYGSDSISIVQNIISQTFSSNEATPSNSFVGSGIYLDGQSRHFLLDGNTIYDNPYYGILLSAGAKEHIIQRNTVYNCGYSQITVNESSNISPDSGNIVHSNIFYALRDDQQVVELISAAENFPSAVFDSNYYFNPYAYQVVIERFGLTGETNPTYYTLHQWQQRREMDIHSKSTFFYGSAYQVIDTIGSNLIGNSFLTNNVDGWLNFHPDTLALLLDNSTPLDFGCLKLNYLLSLPDSVFGPSYASFQLDSGALYQLHLSTYSIKDGNVIVKNKELANGSGQFVTIPRAFPFDESRIDYNSTIPTSDNCEVCYLTLDFSGLDSIVWVDNVTLFPVTGIYNEPKKKSRLFLNPTSSDLTFNLADSIFFNLDQLPVSGSLTLAPYSSTILIFDSSMILSTHEEVLSQSLKIFPDPVSVGGMLTLNLPYQYDQCEISIYDFEGRELFRESVNATEKNFKLKIPSFISQGTYLISVKNRYGVWSGKVVVM